jgi:hypothetical protein
MAPALALALALVLAPAAAGNGETIPQLAATPTAHLFIDPQLLAAPTTTDDDDATTALTGGHTAALSTLLPVGVRAALANVTKEPRSPVLVKDRPWEIWNSYISVVYAPELKRLVMYYNRCLCEKPSLCFNFLLISIPFKTNGDLPRQARDTQIVCQSEL